MNLNLQNIYRIIAVLSCCFAIKLSCVIFIIRAILGNSITNYSISNSILIFVRTTRNLHSHLHEAPMTKKHLQVTGYGLVSKLFSARAQLYYRTIIHIKVLYRDIKMTSNYVLKI